jgi:ribonuclease D
MLPRLDTESTGGAVAQREHEYPSLLHRFIAERQFSNARTRANDRSTIGREAFLVTVAGDTPLHLLAGVRLRRTNERDASHYDRILDLLLQAKKKRRKRILF